MFPRLIVDAHEDIAYNAIAHGRDFRASAADKREAEGETPRDGRATIGLPDALRGNVRVIFATLFVAPASSASRFPRSTYSTPEEAEAAAREQLAYYASLAQDPRVHLIATVRDLEQVVNSPEPRVGLVALMEGADPIVRPQDARAWFDAGVRIVGPAWHATRYAGGTGEPGPLTELGRALMPELERAGLILDTSHLAEASFFEALDRFGGAVIASHSNARQFLQADPESSAEMNRGLLERHLSDEMIRALIARDGVIGAVFFNRFVKPGASREEVGLADVVNHIRHVCDLAGDARHAGLGTDFDGGFGVEGTPREIDTVADLQRMGEALAAANFGDEDIDNILGGNWLRVLRGALPAKLDL
jgi:membrane dipeptidase